MTEEVLSKQLEKFYFNMNIFDEDHVEEVEPEEDLPHPPPTFTEQELAAAKKAAFEEGKQQGIDETKQSRATLIAKSLAKISQEAPTLFEQESLREKTYEREAVRLSLEIFKKLYPMYQERYGFEELKETIINILGKQQGQKQISIYVEPDAVEGIEKMLGELASRGAEVNFKVLADENLSAACCKMLWEDGGAVSNPEKIAHEIRTSIEQVLAADGANSHDSEIKDVETPIEINSVEDGVTGKEEIAEIEVAEKPDKEPEPETKEAEAPVEENLTEDSVLTENSETVAEDTKIEDTETMEKPDE